MCMVQMYSRAEAAEPDDEDAEADGEGDGDDDEHGGAIGENGLPERGRRGHHKGIYNIKSTPLYIIGAPRERVWKVPQGHL